MVQCWLFWSLVETCSDDIKKVMQHECYFKFPLTSVVLVVLWVPVSTRGQSYFAVGTSGICVNMVFSFWINKLQWFWISIIFKEFEFQWFWRIQGSITKCRNTLICKASKTKILISVEPFSSLMSLLFR